MLYFSPAKIIAIIAVCVAAVIFAAPNFFSAETVKSWPSWVPNNQLSLGLDLRGGAHLLYDMDVDELRANMIRNQRGDVRQRLNENKIGGRTGRIANGVQTRLANPADRPKALETLRQLAQPVNLGIFAGSDERDLTVTQISDQVIHILINNAGVQQRIGEAMSGAIETVRRRVDAYGTAEPIITRQGSNRILVQVEGDAPEEDKVAYAEAIDFAGLRDY